MYLTPHQGNFVTAVMLKNQNDAVPDGETLNDIYMCNHFGTIPIFYGEADGRTDGRKW